MLAMGWASATDWASATGAMEESILARPAAVYLWSSPRAWPRTVLKAAKLRWCPGMPSVGAAPLWSSEVAADPTWSSEAELWSLMVARAKRPASG